MSSETASTWLRAQPALTGTPRSVAFDDLPDDPTALFLSWISEAAELGVAEPHAASLATVDADGVPDARTLILKDVSDRGWAFAGHRASQKAEQLLAHPAAALNFWWQPLVRAVRVRGAVQEATPEESAADLAARSASAREGIGPGEWVLWRLAPTSIEFWNGAVDRRHTRILYVREGEGWSHTVTGGDTNGDTAT